MDNNQRGGRGDNGEKRMNQFAGTTIKDTWTRPRRGVIRGGRWGWLGSGEWWRVNADNCT